MNYLENIVQAIRVIEATPEEAIDLSQYTCGTLHCTAGWLATDPFFNALGLQLNSYDHPIVPEIHDFSSDEGLEYLFGPTGTYGSKCSWDYLFHTAGAGFWDETFHTTNDKALALARLYKAKAILESRATESAK